MGFTNSALVQELRQRFTFCLIPALFVFICLFIYNQFFLACLLDFLQSWYATPQLVVFHWFEGVEVSFALAWYGMLLVCMPWWCCHIWWFLAPALYTSERYLISWVAFVGGLLFYIGAMLGFFIVTPMLFRYAYWFLPTYTPWVLSLSACLHMIWSSMLFTGIALQVPIVLSLLVYLQVLNLSLLQSVRPYVIVGAFIVGMFCTPPDMFAQILLALPLWALFEVSLLLCWWLDFSKSSVSLTCIDAETDALHDPNM
ncbi:MAG: twin-arginine translocase subunit TatC [Pseudomonadota bacterium]|nr:twin-arginine translocase subunit TatC [Pseudomonadota bacterium]